VRGAVPQQPSQSSWRFAKTGAKPGGRSAQTIAILVVFALALLAQSVFALQKNFFKNSPKIACQAPKPPKSLKQNKIELAR
jgi:hypothetical protein